MANLFICYSRKDLKFVQALDNALGKQGWDTWFDLKHGTGGAYWRNEICEAIESSDIFLLIMSTEALSSENCNLEIEHAIRFKKRIIPLVHRQPNKKILAGEWFDKSWEDLARKNWDFINEIGWIEFTEDDDFEKALQLLILTLNTDFDYVRIHTRLAQRAKDWDNNQRNSSFLMVGDDLKQAEQWLVVSESKSPKPTELQLQYIFAGVTEREKVERQHNEQKDLEIRLQQMSARRLRYLVAGLVVFVIVALILLFTAMSEGKRANSEAENSLSRQLAAQSLYYLLNDQIDMALLLSMESIRIKDTSETRSSLLSALQYSPFLETFLRGHTLPIEAIALNSQESILASGSLDHSIILWNTDTEQILQRITIDNQFVAKQLHFSSVNENELIAVGCRTDNQYYCKADAKVYQWNLETNEEASYMLPEGHGALDDVVFSPRGDLFAYTASNGDIVLWSLETDQQLMQIASGSGQTNPMTSRSMAISPNGEILAYVDRPISDELVIRLWSIPNSQHLAQNLGTHKNWVTAIAFSPDGQYLASAWSDFDAYTISVEDITTGEVINEWSAGYHNSVQDLVFNPLDSSMLASATGESVLVWNWNTGRQVSLPFLGSKEGVAELIVIPSNLQIASIGYMDNNVTIWSLEDHPSIGHLVTSGIVETITQVAFNPARSTFAFLTQNAELRIVDAITGRTIKTKTVADSNSSIFYSSSGRYLALSNGFQSIDLLDLDLDKSISLEGEENFFHSSDLAFSFNDQILVVRGSQDSVHIFDVQTGKLLETHLLLESSLSSGNSTAIELDPSNNILAVGLSDNTIALWDLENRLVLRRLVGHEDNVNSLQFSPNGQILSSSSYDSSIILWEVATGKIIGRPLYGHPDYATNLAFSPGGNILASGGKRGEIILWDIVTQLPMGKPLEGYTGSVKDLIFTNDGQNLFSYDHSSTIVEWDVNIDEWRSTACRIISRNLTIDEWRQFLGDRPYLQTCSLS